MSDVTINRLREEHRIYTYAQEKGGQKLHLVEKFADGAVLLRAVCGRRPSNGWRMTINVPLGHMCGNCRRLS